MTIWERGSSASSGSESYSYTPDNNLGGGIVADVSGMQRVVEENVRNVPLAETPPDSTLVRQNIGSFELHIL